LEREITCYIDDYEMRKTICNLIHQDPFSMKPPLAPTLVALLLLCSCRQKDSKTIADTAGTQQTQTTTPGNYSDHKLFKKDIAGYTVTIVERDALPDSNGSVNNDIEGNYIFIRNLQSNKLDSLLLESQEDIDDLTVIDLSDSLKFRNPALMISWTGDSDMEMNEFVAYRNDSLKTIFVLEDIVCLQRTDASTIRGFVRRRDEIVAWSQTDYPVIISVKDGTTDEPLPPVQYIGVSTRALEDIKVYKMLGRKDSVRYTIRKGTQLTVDTLYRARNIVRILVADSIILHAPAEGLILKIESNTAG
jgi:hypothetical protein